MTTPPPPSRLTSGHWASRPSSWPKGSLPTQTCTPCECSSIFPRVPRRRSTAISPRASKNSPNPASIKTRLLWEPHSDSETRSPVIFSTLLLFCHLIVLKKNNFKCFSFHNLLIDCSLTCSLPPSCGGKAPHTPCYFFPIVFPLPGDHWNELPCSIVTLSVVFLWSGRTASHSQGAAQAQVHRQALQEDVLPQRVDWQVPEVQAGGTQRQQLGRLGQVVAAARSHKWSCFWRLTGVCVCVFFYCVCVCMCSESSNKENSDSPEWSFTTVRKKKPGGRKVLNGTVSIPPCVHAVLYWFEYFSNVEKHSFVFWFNAAWLRLMVTFTFIEKHTQFCLLFFSSFCFLQAPDQLGKSASLSTVISPVFTEVRWRSIIY